MYVLTINVNKLPAFQMTLVLSKITDAVNKICLHEKFNLKMPLQFFLVCIVWEIHTQSMMPEQQHQAKKKAAGSQDLMTF